MLVEAPGLSAWGKGRKTCRGGGQYFAVPLILIPPHYVPEKLDSAKFIFCPVPSTKYPQIIAHVSTHGFSLGTKRKL